MTTPVHNSRQGLLPWLAALVLPMTALVGAPQALAGAQLDALVEAVTPCIGVGKPQPCPAGLRALQQLRQAPAYAKADRACQEQASAFERVLQLLPIQDVTDQTVQASLDGLRQVCSASGL
jgi:hypothetical protein